jgi:hypothetical protein
MSTLVLWQGLAGCVAVPVVEQASHEAPINSANMSCSVPYALKQDCNASWGGGRILSIDGFDVAVTATDDGSTVVIFDAHPIQDTWHNPLIFNSPRLAKASNTSYQVVRDVLEQNGLRVVRAIPITMFFDTSGYVLELDGNGYDVLKTFTVKVR